VASLTIIEDGAQRGVVLTGEVSIGRASDNVIRLADPRVSRNHAVLVPAGLGYCLVDLESANGTCVNGAAFVRRPLAEGDEIQIGGTVLRYSGSSEIILEGIEESTRRMVRRSRRFGRRRRQEVLVPAITGSDPNESTHLG
jgi:pSer/pThr/pTyr-binding forkhead associated (FHA) protein